MQTPWAGLQPYLSGNGDTAGLYSLGYQNYLNRSSGQGVAPVNHSQLAAQQMTLDNAMNVVPGIGAAYGDILGRLVGSTGTGPLQGNYVSPYSAPEPVAAGTSASAAVQERPGPVAPPGGHVVTPTPGVDDSKGGVVPGQRPPITVQPPGGPTPGGGTTIQAQRPTFGINQPAGQAGGATQIGGGAPGPSIAPRPVYAGITAGAGQQRPTMGINRPTGQAGAATQMGQPQTGGGDPMPPQFAQTRPTISTRPMIRPASPTGFAPMNKGDQQPGFKPMIGDNEGGNDSNGGDGTGGQGGGGADGSENGTGNGIGAGSDQSGVGPGGAGGGQSQEETGNIVSEEGVNLPTPDRNREVAAGTYTPVSIDQMQRNLPGLGNAKGGNQGSYNFGGQGVGRVDLSPVGGGVRLPPREGEPTPGSIGNRFAGNPSANSNALAGMGRVGAGALDRLAMAGDPGNNPYLAQQAQGAADLVNRNLQENILPGIGDSAAGAGMASSSRRAISEGIASRGAAEEIARQTYGMYGQAYRDSAAANQAAAGLYNTAAGQQAGTNTAQMGLGVQQRGQDISAMLQGRGQDVSQNTALAGLGLQQRQQDLTSLNQAAGMLPNLADMYMQPASMVESVGQQQQGQMQSQLDAPYRALIEYGGLLGQGGQYTDTSTPLYRNRLGGAAGGAMAGMQMGGPWGAAVGGALGYMAS
jgi:hypothetical protein